MNELIGIKNIYKVYQKGNIEINAVNDISIKIDIGENVAIVGASGSGKSTLMNILGCLDVPTKGEYKLCGKNVLEFSDKEISKVRNKDIGFIFQGFNLIPTLNALENVELPLLYRKTKSKERRKLATQALQKVGLGDRLFHYPKEMSGGQQQRVAIARAIVSRPPIILADEPTGNLDSKSGKEIIKILNGLSKEGKTVIMITHDDSIANMSDRIIKISDGKIISDKLRLSI